MFRFTAIGIVVVLHGNRLTLRTEEVGDVECSLERLRGPRPYMGAQVIASGTIGYGETKDTFTFIIEKLSIEKY